MKTQKLSKIPYLKTNWQVHESMTGWNHVKQFSLITWVFFSHGDFALAFMAVDAQSGESVVQCKMIRNETQE